MYCVRSLLFRIAAVLSVIVVTPQLQATSTDVEIKPDLKYLVEPAHKKWLKENDKAMLRQAGRACKEQDFNAFFFASVRSKAVRLRYFTSPINTTHGTISAKTHEFPITLLDTTNYVASASLAKADGRAERVMMRIAVTADRGAYVSWRRVDPGVDRDEFATEDDQPYGPRGRLIFKRTKACWALTEDRIEQ
jgi:hypothetical protein